MQHWLGNHHHHNRQSPSSINVAIHHFYHQWLSNFCLMILMSLTEKKGLLPPSKKQLDSLLVFARSRSNVLFTKLSYFSSISSRSGFFWFLHEFLVFLLKLCIVIMIVMQEGRMQRLVEHVNIWLLPGGAGRAPRWGQAGATIQLQLRLHWTLLLTW